jgi:hypothetical protein
VKILAGNGRLLKNHSQSLSTGLRTNGEGIENLEKFPFMLSLVEAFLGFFRRI